MVTIHNWSNYPHPPKQPKLWSSTQQSNWGKNCLELRSKKYFLNTWGGRSLTYPCLGWQPNPQLGAPEKDFGLSFCQRETFRTLRIGHRRQRVRHLGRHFRRSRGFLSAFLGCRGGADSRECGEVSVSESRIRIGILESSQLAPKKRQQIQQRVIVRISLTAPPPTYYGT